MNNLSGSKTKIEDEKSGTRREIAYKKHDGSRESKVVYIPGFMSNMSGIKATTFNAFCQEYGLTYTRYDPTGLGESRPISLSNARFSHWIQDAEHILNLVDGPQVVIGSSMGGWIALHLYLKNPEKFSGLVLIAPGINFTKKYFDKINASLPNSAVHCLEKGETINFQHPEYGTFPVSYDLADDMYQNELDLSQGLNVHCPIRIVHGMMDEDVPYMESMNLLQSLKSADVQLAYVKDGDHRLSREEDLKLIFYQILRLAT